MLENRTKAKLAAGEPAFGCFVRTAEPQLSEYVAMLGWDFLVFDAEHGSLQPREVEDLCRAIEPRGTTPMVRVTTNDAPTILRFLDTGAHGVHVPWDPRPRRQPRVRVGLARADRRVRPTGEPRDPGGDPGRDAGRGRRDRRLPRDRR